MTLALLITAVTGAWAQSSLNVVELEVPTVWENDESNVTAGDLPGFKTSTSAEAQAWTGAPAKGTAMLVYAFDGDNVCVVPFQDGTAGKGGETTYTKKDIFGSKSYMKFYYTAEPTEWSLTPDADKKVWTLAKMPASNIELQVEYFAESNLFLSKDALADKANIAVKAGDLGVQFGDDGKSANTVTEGTEMTVKFNGTKKLLGVKVEEKKAVDPANAYLKWDADQKKLVATEIPAEATKVENSTSYVEWSGTYVVEGNVTITGNITLSGNVNLIIKDGATLTAKKIIGYNNNLSIYGQANQTGQLVVDNSGDDAITSMKTLEVHSAKLTATTSYSDRGAFCLIGTFNVYGGSVDATATGSHGGYGIWLGTDGSMNIYGGEVKAVGKGTGSYSYGITANNSSTVTVNGGKLWAENADKKALRDVNIQKGAGFSGKIEYSSDKSTWSETVDADAKYVRAGY